MTKATKIFGVYLIPAGDDPLYAFGSKLLGYDIWKQERSLPSRFSNWIGGATNFGFHCTVGEALGFREKHLAELQARLSWICSRVGSFGLKGFHLNHNFWAGNKALVVGLKDDSQNLQRLAGLITTTMNPLYMESPYYPELLPLLPKFSKKYYIKYGSPQVLEYFEPHFTLASNLNDEISRSDMVSHVEETFFSKHPHHELFVDRVHLVGQKDDGYFEVISSYMLGSGKKAQ